MNSKITGAAVALTLISGCGSAESEPYSIEQDAKVAVQEFDDIYSCGIDISIKIGNVVIDSVYPGSEGDKILGTAIPGELTVDPYTEVLEKTNPGLTKYVAGHEASHACNIGQITYDKPFMFDNGVVMTGSKGFVATGYTTADGEDLTFNFVDEGVAELLVSSHMIIETSSSAIKASKDVTKTLIDQSGISLQQLQDLQEKSDLLGFTALIYDKSPTEITETDLSKLFDTYIQAVNKAAKN